MTELLAPDARVSGVVTSELALGTDGVEHSVKGGTKVEDLELTLADGAGGAPVTVRDPELELDVDARVDAERLDVRLAGLELTSELARARLRGGLGGLGGQAPSGTAPPSLSFDELEGELSYVPDTLAPLLAPYLPGTLSGANEERTTFRLTGTPASLEPAALLAALDAEAIVGIGTFEAAGFTTSGDVALAVEEGRAALTCDLAANGGTLVVEGALSTGSAEPEEASPLTVGVRMQRVQANSRMSSLLALLHPAFGTVQELAASQLQGVFSCDLDLRYDEAVSIEELSELIANGWEGLPKDRIGGGGTFSIDAARLTGSTLLGELMAKLGVEDGEELDIDPVRFQIEEGRLRYHRPWTWSFSGTETTFSGSIGLDETLALVWEVPVTARLADEHDLLAPLEGESISIPLTGTVRRPRIEWTAGLEDAAERALKHELSDKLEEELGIEGGGLPGGLGELLGLGTEGAEDGDEEASADQVTAASLFDEAGRLWDAGEKAAAAKLYKRIRSEFKLSLVYALNRDRIKDRSRYQE